LGTANSTFTLDNISLKQIATPAPALKVVGYDGYPILSIGGDVTENVALGNRALFSNTTGTSNVAIGMNALLRNTTGDNNSAIGYHSLLQNTTGHSNTSVGMFALASNTTGTGNTATGGFTLGSNTTGIGNTANGYNSLSKNTTGSNNTAIGDYTFYNNTTGSYNVALGYLAGYLETTGYDNVFIGHSSGTGTDITTGFNNIGIGSSIKFPSSSINNMLNIGNFIFANLPATSSALTLGSQPMNGQFGIATTSPWATLSVAGVSTYSNTPLFAVSSSTPTSTTTVFMIDSQGKVGIGTTTPNYVLDVKNSTSATIVANFTNSGGSYCAINPATSGFTCSSDARMKKNILAIDASSTLDKLVQLNPVTYNWNYENDTDSLHSGLIAQDVRQQFPDLVTDTGGSLSLNYAGFAPYLIDSIKVIVSEIRDMPKTLIAWFGDKGNGITKLFVEEIDTAKVNSDAVQTKTLCVGQTCVTEDQLKTLLNQSGQQTAAAPINEPLEGTDLQNTPPSADDQPTTPPTTSSEPQQDSTTPPLDGTS